MTLANSAHFQQAQDRQAAELMERLIRVEPDALPAWAEEHAASWLADRGARWDHVRGVAQQAQRVSRALDEDDRRYLVAAAWLHDIGYAPTLAGRLAEIAERYGAEHLVVRCLQRAHDHRAGAVRRTEERLRAHRVPEQSGDGWRGSVLQEVLEAPRC